ncbi:hypothetical protein CM1_00740 [Mycoplasmoides genitalium M6320]|uniref:Uncharacterized protein n=1 Tax=Mycoplasmoides genitalium M6320 TaxID=662945 RepID=A0ABC7ZIM2_MYCGT|nr:hypothetical protein [Mycoplasmoides genitalium]AFQ03938.1 hypothetical protein CM1_00740 [Mycoplasmoides genitalium M6320]
MQYSALIPLFILLISLVLFCFSFRKNQSENQIVKILFFAYCIDFLALILAVMLLTFLSHGLLSLAILIPVWVFSIIMFFVMVISHYPLMKRLFGN